MEAVSAMIDGEAPPPRLADFQRLLQQLKTTAPTDDRMLKALTLLWLGHEPTLLSVHFIAVLNGHDGMHRLERAGARLLHCMPDGVQAAAVFLTNFGRWKADGAKGPLDDLGITDSSVVRLAGAFFEFMTTHEISKSEIGALNSVRSAAVLVRTSAPVLRNAGLLTEAMELEAFWGAIEHHMRSSEETLVLSPGYLLNVGHLLYVAALIEAQRAGTFVPRKTAAILGKTHNPFLREMVLREMEPQVPQTYRYGETVDGSKTFTLADGQRRHMMHLVSDAGRVWSDSGRPFLTLDPEIVERGYAALAEFGIKPDDRIVGLHVREAGFHAQDQTARLNDAMLYGMRNADIDSYRPAIDRIISNGGVVVRLGDESMTPIGSRPGFVDYPFTHIKADWMDAFLASQCHYMIGTPSGMSFVPMLFGRPIAFTNWTTLINIIDTPNVLTIFKPLYEASGRLVPFDTFAARYAWLANDRDLALHGVFHRSNTSNEILEVVDMMERHADRSTGRLDVTDAVFADSQKRFINFAIARRPKIPPGFWSRYYGR